MPERSRHQRSDTYPEHKSRERGTSENAEPSSFDDRHHKKDRERGYTTKRDTEERGSGDDRRGKQKPDFSSRQRDMTTPSYNDAPVHLDSLHQVPSRVYSDASAYRPTSEEEYSEHTQALYNLKYIITSRGLCQLIELFVNLLLVICAGVPYSNNGGYRDLASLGGLYHYYYGGANAFAGAEAERVKELDQLFHQLKRPPYVFTMACGGALMAYACVMLGLGLFRVTYRCPPVLLVEALLNFLIGLGYIPAMAFYFIKLQETYDNVICKERETLYKSKGHQGFECKFNGADIAGGLFGVMGVIVFIFGAVLAFRAFRSVRQLKKRSRDGNNF